MKSEFNYFQFKAFDDAQIQSLVSKREGETKLGEQISPYGAESTCKYVVLGISEDIGPQGNMGLPGSKNAFNSFLSRFLNVQSNRFLNGDQICLLGEISQVESFKTIEEARIRIEVLDEFVQSIIEPIIASGKIPIVIGGGHNNAFPLIKSTFAALQKKIDVVNFDPHSDCRALEGRHSGNPFSYATEEGFINNYTVLGLHEQYNSESLLKYLDKNNYHYTFFEDYIDQSRDLKNDIDEILLNRDSNTPLGIELDLDSISMMPTSAFTPSGFSLNEARFFVRRIAKDNNITYIHIPEGAPQTLHEEKIVGKAIAYLVIDFIKKMK